MRNTVRTLGVISLAFGIAAPAAAQERGLSVAPYIGASISHMEYSEAGIRANPSMASVHAGAYVSENVAVELRAGMGMSGDNVPFGPMKADLEVAETLGLYARGNIPVASGVMPYAVAGYSYNKLKVTVPELGSASASERGVSYGLGLEVDLDVNKTFSVEYMRLMNRHKDGYAVDSLSFRLTHHF